MTASQTTVTDRSVLATVEDDVLHLIDLALIEDRGPGDWTSKWTVNARTRVRARVSAKSTGIIAGLTPSLAVFVRLDGRIQTNRLVEEGNLVEAGTVLYEVKGPARAILAGERVALNFLQRLSGIATLTRNYVDAVAGTGVRILDTRKTTPAWRQLEKSAVLAGGGVNHRLGLYDAVLIKENHISIAGSIEEAIARVRDQNGRGLLITVEVSTLEELEIALSAGVDRVLLDNMDIDTLRTAVQMAGKVHDRPELEASGNMTLERVPDVAATGVDCISVGALTHSAPALDVSLTIVHS